MASDRAITSQSIAVEAMGACPILARVTTKRTVNASIAQLQNCVPRLVLLVVAGVPPLNLPAAADTAACTAA
jgi:hypothetical protein